MFLTLGVVIGRLPLWSSLGLTVGSGVKVGANAYAKRQSQCDLLGSSTVLTRHERRSGRQGSLECLPEVSIYRFDEH